MANPSVVDVTLTLDTSIYADGDVLSDFAEVKDFFRDKNDVRKLTSIMVVDEDDQGVALDVMFANANVSLGTFNAAPNISDASSRSILGGMRIATTDYLDLGGTRVATVRGINLMLKSVADSTSIYVGTISRGGTPTYTVNGLKLRLGLE